MAFLRNKSLGEEITGRTQQMIGTVSHDRSRDSLGMARNVAGRAGNLTSHALASAGRRIRRRPGLSIAIGTGLGLAAITAAWLLARHHARVRPEEDEHDPTRQRPTTASGDALDGSGEDNPISGEARFY